MQQSAIAAAKLRREVDQPPGLANFGEETPSLRKVAPHPNLFAGPTHHLRALVAQQPCEGVVDRHDRLFSSGGHAEWKGTVPEYLSESLICTLGSANGTFELRDIAREDGDPEATPVPDQSVERQPERLALDESPMLQAERAFVDGTPKELSPAQGILGVEQVLEHKPDP